ncbi:hypothetical protein TRFO_34916 [Tritrichomonas foetus]|uniref:AIR9-like A9 domain-containing protein n=1 Tax=Tritrichomonas foetus TaxID=1144522 RepID=A0A1J4JJV5_9EUKA|nr:hypothetical protein TRFO_34916 [Tritrichomonas foetus]|eukprot:OHS98639.1 hypothetical protein TRFO_34916 [Tritrichomonas foetus]
MNKSKIQRSPLSPRLRPPKSPQVQSKLDRVAGTFLSLAGKNLSSLPTSQPSFSPMRSSGVQQVSSPNLLYLDLSDNRLPATALKPVNPNITVLNLTNNPLLSCSFPSFHNLRTLTIDNCGLKNFEGMPFLPHLCFLSAANNEITSFKGLHIMPDLESINLIGNPIEFAPKIVIAAVGSLNLQKINRQIIETEHVKAAFALSPLVAYSLRMGRTVETFQTAEDEINEAQNFLTNKLTTHLEKTNVVEAKTRLTIESYKDGHAITVPFKSINVKWYKSHFPNDKGSEWYPIPTPKNPSILPVTMMIRLHLVRCDFTLDNKTFSIFTDDIVGREKKDLALPYPIDPSISGVPIEGSLISVLPMPFETRIAWVREGETIAENVQSIMLTDKDIGKSVACLLQPHSPYDDKIFFGTIFTATDVVAPLMPIVTGISFPDNVMEGQKIVFNRTINPDREGESQIVVERAISQYGEWILVAELKKDDISYTPNCFDVGKFLRVTYTPVTTEGTTGVTVYFYSKSKVLPTMPTFKNPFIGGQIKTFYPLVALADYSGGIKGKCTYDWYFSKRPIDVKKGPSRRLQKVAHDTQYFTPDNNMADGYLACQMVPVRNDEVVGDPVFVCTETSILLDDAPKPIPGCPTEAYVGRTLKFPITVEIYLSKTTGMCGFDLLKTGQTYTPREKHMGRILRVVTENNDQIIGEIKPATPVILDVSITANKYTPGELISLSIKHKHLMPDKVEIVWLRCNSEFEIPVAMDNPEYIIQAKDIGFQIKAAVTPMDYAMNRLQTKVSQLTPVIKECEFINPTIIGDLQEDREIQVNCSAELSSVTWYRVEGTKTVEIGHHNTFSLTAKEVGYFIKAKIVVAGTGMSLSTITSEAVRPAPPVVSVNISPEVVEGQLITPEVIYHGGTEGQSLIRWYRETDDGWEFITEGINYQTSIDDVDSVLRLVYIPIRNDKERGEQVVVECGPVDALPPSVSKVTLKQNAVGNIEVSGVYKGGFEGMSFIIWRVYNDEDSEPVSLGKTVEKEMVPSPEYCGKKIDAIYVPIRSDGMGGNPVISNNKVTMQPLPSVLSAEILVKGGQLLPGALMRCRATFEQGVKGTYQWHKGDGTAWEIIEGANDVEFSPTEDEIGFLLLCQVTAIDQRGWKSAPYSAVTTSHIQKPKSVLKVVEPLTENGKLVTGALLSSNLELNQLSAARLKWQKLIDGHWKTITHDDTYLISVNDVGQQMRCVTRSGRASEPTRVIELEPNVASMVRSIVKANAFKVKCKAKIGVVIWTISIKGNEITLSTKNGTQKPAKINTISVDAVAGTPDVMKLYLDPSSKFTLIPDISDDKRMESVIKKENTRDLVVATIRAFIANAQK